MSRALVASTAPVQRFTLLECTPCAMLYALRRARKHQTTPPNTKPSPVEDLWRPHTASFAVDAATAAVLMGGASAVLVPASLVRYMEGVRDPSHPSSSIAAPASSPATVLLPQWATLRDEGRLVVLVGACGVPTLLEAHPAYRRLCVPVPGGPLAARTLFGAREAAFYADALPAATAAIAAARQLNKHVEWCAWVRSGLTCRSEGSFIAPIRVAERAAALLSDDEDGGCNRVLLEEAIPGLTPRWLETVAKTAAACGVPSAAIAIALCDSPGAPQLLAKAAEVGLTQLATSTLRGSVAGEADGCLFDGTQPLLSLAAAVRFGVGWGEAYGGVSKVSEQDEDLLVASAEFAETLVDEWAALRSDDESTQAG